MSLELRYPDGATDRVRLGLGRFYVYDVPAEHLATVHAHGLLLVARDAAGNELASAVVPSDGVTPTRPSERTRDPLEAVTSVDDGDLSTVLAVSGSAPGGAATVELAPAEGPWVRRCLRCPGRWHGRCGSDPPSHTRTAPTHALAPLPPAGRGGPAAATAVGFRAGPGIGGQLTKLIVRFLRESMPRTGERRGVGHDMRGCAGWRARSRSSTAVSASASRSRTS